MNNETAGHSGAYTQAELLAMVEQMRVVITAFYGMAQRTHVHGFLEFCGMMGKYADLCSAAAKLGIDFTTANVHGDATIPVQGHDIAYLGEKFECIFTGLLKTPEQKLQFCQAAGLRPRVTEETLRNMGGIPVYELALVGGRSSNSMDDRGEPAMVVTKATMPVPSNAMLLQTTPEYMLAAIQALLPTACEAKVDRCEAGWFMDVEYQGHHGVVQFINGKYGVSFPAPGAFVSPFDVHPDVPWSNADNAAQQAAQCLAAKTFTTVKP